MRVVVVHSFYRTAAPSGENTAVALQVEQLKRFGHEVIQVTTGSDELGNSPLAKLTTATALMIRGGRQTVEGINALKPDVVHVHNLFPNYNPGFIRGLDAPLIATLHNFRYSCAAGTFYREGNACFECPTNGSIRAVRHACYRGSRLATLPLAFSVSAGAQKDVRISHASALIALSPRALRMHQSAGVPADKMVLLPNFVPNSQFLANSKNRGWIYVGRLSPEKGILEAAANWSRSSGPLSIYGDGPLRAAIEALENPSVTIYGTLERKELIAALSTGRGLIFPSRWAESAYPMSYLDALSVGLPVAALNGNGASDHIRQYNTGSVFSSWDEMGACLHKIELGWDKISAQCVRVYREQFDPDRWASSISSIYEKAVSQTDVGTQNT